MRKKTIAHSLILLFLLPLQALSQVSETQQSNPVILVPDNPISAMLDSLMYVKYFDHTSKKVKHSSVNKYHYADDSVPTFDAATYDARIKKLDAKSPIRLEYNKHVKGYIDLYAVRKREMVSRMLGLTYLYFPLFEDKLDKYNLPIELKYLAVVESALNATARSKAGAVGLWQFMFSTGKMYDLEVNSYYDQRCDPVKSTEAACKYLSFLYRMFGDWHLALAAYNAGPGTVNKAIRRSGGKMNYWELMPYLPAETNGYVPAFIAVNYVMNYAQEHNLYPTPPKFYHYQVDTVHVQQPISYSQLCSTLEITADELSYLNPTYKRQYIPATGHESSTLCLPSKCIGSFITNESAIYASAIKTPETEAATEDVQYVTQKVKKYHTVKSGEHLTLIARKYNCSVKEIRSWNKLRSNTVARGQKLVIYTQEQKAVPVLAKKEEVKPTPENTAKTDAPAKEQLTENSSTAAAESKTVKPKPATYTVQRGDTLWKIAQEYNISVDELKKLNNIDKGSDLKAGTRIKVG